MKIVQKGPAFLVEWKCEVSCKHCQTVVELVVDDVKVTVSTGDSDYGYSRTTSLTWTCPLCDTYNWLLGDNRDSYFKGNPKVKP